MYMYTFMYINKYVKFFGIGMLHVPVYVHMCTGTTCTYIHVSLGTLDRRATRCFTISIFYIFCQKYTLVLAASNQMSRRVEIILYMYVHVCMYSLALLLTY